MPSGRPCGGAAGASESERDTTNSSGATTRDAPRATGRKERDSLQAQRKNATGRCREKNRRYRIQVKKESVNTLSGAASQCTKQKMCNLLRNGYSAGPSWPHCFGLGLKDDGSFSGVRRQSAGSNTARFPSSRYLPALEKSDDRPSDGD